MRIPHPIPYQGSKRNLVNAILSCFPSGADRLFEPFAGSAAVSLAALVYGKVCYVFLNDINAPLIELWSAIADHPEDLAEQYRRLWEAQLGREREYYDLVRAEFNSTKKPGHLLYLLARCVKASVRYNANGAFNQSPDNRRKGAHPDTMAYHIRRASDLLRGRSTLSSGDYRECLHGVSPRDLVYMDPPYQGVSSNRTRRYVQGLSFDRFVRTLSDLNDHAVSYVVSYDGRTGPKRHGRPLPPELRLAHIEIATGRSTQATLLGRVSTTYESLYLSPALLGRIGRTPQAATQQSQEQLPLIAAS